MRYFNDITFVANALFTGSIDALVIGYLKSGSLTLQIDSACHSVNAGTAFWLLPGQQCDARSSGPFEVQHVAARGPRVDRIIDSGLVGRSEQPWVLVTNLAEFEHTFSSLLDGVRATTSTKHRNNVLLFERLCLRTAESRHMRHSWAQTPQTRVASVVRQMQLRPGQDYDLRATARFCALSYTHFRRIFQELSGQAPREYLTSCRMRHAAKLLAEGSRGSVTSVASDVGYRDVHYFSELFKRRMGVAPGQLVTRRTDANKN